MHRFRGVIAVTMLSSTIAIASPADDLARAAQELATHGDFVGAATKFREAYAQDPRPELMCNVGVAFYKAKDYPHAYRYLDQCVASGTGLDGAFIATVHQVIAAVDTKLRAGDFTPLDLAVEPATATTIVTYVAGHPEEPIVGSRRAWVPFGAYELTIHAEGFTDQHVADSARAHDALPIHVRLAPVVVVPIEPKPIEPKPIEPKPIEPRPDPAIVHPLPAPASPSRAPAVTATVIAGTFGLATLGLYLAALSRASDANGASDLPTYNRDADRARMWQHLSWGSGALAGATAIVAGYLWFRATRHTTVEVHATGVAVKSSF